MTSDPLSSLPLPLRNAADFLRSDATDPPVTVIREIRVRAGHEIAFEGFMTRLIEAAFLQPGHLGATVVRPQLPGYAYRFIYKFDKRSNLERWHGSPHRAELAAPIAALIESDRFDQYPGLETWFNLPAAPLSGSPPKWKTTIMSWVAIYPLVLGGSCTMKALHFAAPMAVQIFILTAVVSVLCGLIFAAPPIVAIPVFCMILWV